MTNEEWEIKAKRERIEEDVSGIDMNIECLFLEAETEEETQGICNALCRMIALIRERQNIEIDIRKISKEIQEVLMHGK